MWMETCIGEMEDICSNGPKQKGFLFFFVIFILNAFSDFHSMTGFSCPQITWKTTRSFSFYPTPCSAPIKSSMIQARRE